MSEPATDYEKGILRLVERVRELNDPWNSTERRKEIEGLADRLNALLRDLETPGAAQGEIEYEHDQPPAPEIGPDGLPTPGERWAPTYAATLHHMRALRDSAKRAAEALPGPRLRPALPFAALGLLHLRYRHGFERPRLSDSSPDVRELGRVCNAAGLFKSPEALRNALSKEMQSFDPNFIRPDIERIIEGG